MTPLQRKRKHIQRRRFARKALVSRAVPIQAHPYSIEREYTRVLIGMFSDMRDLTLTKLTTDADDTKDERKTRNVVKDITGLKVRYMKTVTTKRSTKAAETAAKRVNAFNKGAMTDQFQSVLGINPFTQGKGKIPDKVIDSFVKQNVALIKTIPERFFSELETLVREKTALGWTNKDIAKLVEERYRVSKSNAERIAVDQVGKLNSQLTEIRQKSLGIHRYTWRTSRDERVRKRHKDLEGRTFEYSSPPPDGNPGQPIRCRCRASPVISDMLEGL